MASPVSKLHLGAILTIFTCIIIECCSESRNGKGFSSPLSFPPLHNNHTFLPVSVAWSALLTTRFNNNAVQSNQENHIKSTVKYINESKTGYGEKSPSEKDNYQSTVPYSPFKESPPARRKLGSNKTASTSCPGSCRNKCGDIAADYNSDNLFPCHCDHACWLYGDCCIDYYPYCLRININATDKKILRATLGNLQTYSQVLNFQKQFYWKSISVCVNLTSTENYFQLVSKCSSEEEVGAKFEALYRDLTDPSPWRPKLFIGLSQDEIKQRCERDLPLNSNQYVLDQTHVSLNLGPAIHFYNVFCAICNGVRPGEVSTWTINVTCDSTTFAQSDTNLLLTVFERATVNKSCTIKNVANSTHRLRLCFPYNHSASYSTENVSSSGSSNVREVTSVRNSSCCEPSHDSHSTVCKRYQYTYMDNRTRTIYKNPHCFMCSVQSGSPSSTVNVSDSNAAESWITQMTTMNGIAGECACQAYATMFPAIKTSSHRLRDCINYVCHIQRFPTPPARLLLDFGPPKIKVPFNERTMIIENKSCPQGQVYVPLVDTCRGVNCMPGTRWQDNRCVPVNACPETASENNGTCQEGEGQTINYSYRPFPEGSTFISLDISLEYIFGPVRANGSSLPDMARNILAKNKKKFNMKSETEIYSPISGRKCCSGFSRNTSGLFEVSSLKDMWVKQRKRNNSTKLNHAEYNQTVTQVRQLINKTVNVHTRNQSLNVKTIFCSGSTCLKGSLPFQQTGSCAYKRPPHNPCLVSPMRQPESHQRVQRSYECLSFGIHLKSSADLDVVLKVARVMVTDIITVAHDNNFLVSRAELTNSLDHRSDQPTREADTKTNQGNDEGFITNNSSQLCQPGERVTFKETNVELSQNGTYIVHFNGHQTPLGAFSFRTELDVHSMTSEGEIKATNISWCQTDLSKLQCQSMQYEVYNSSNFVFINGTLVLTNMAETFTQFLGNVSTRMTTLNELVSLFPKMFAGGNATIVKEGQYIATRSEVLACSNFSITYQQEHETFHASTRFVFMPDSEEEIIATFMSSVISITCLTGTLAVYSFLPSLQNVPGKIVMSLSASLVCAQILFLTCQKPEGLACEIYAAFHHAAWLASFSWLTALSVDLAYILNCQSSMNCDTSRNNIFKFLSAVCWGFPLMFSGFCFVLFKTHFVSMGYGQNGVCWIGNMQSLLLSFGVPVFVIIAVTSGCAVAVVKAIGNSVSFRSRSTSSRRKSRKQVIVCVNLCLLMGFTWLFYFLAVGVGNTVLWALHSFVNGSQGLYIFLCFVARKSLMLKFVTKLKLINIWSRKPDRPMPEVLKLAASVITLNSSIHSRVHSRQPI